MSAVNHGYNRLKAAALTTFVLVVALTAVRGCHAFRHGINWKGPLASIEMERRAYWRAHQ